MPHQQKVSTSKAPSRTRARGDGSPKAQQRLVRELMDQILVSEVMAKPVACWLYATLDAVEALFLESDAQAIAVVDDEGKPQGIITKTDLVMQHFSSEDGGPSRELPAARLMSPAVATTIASSSLGDVLRIVEREQIYTLPVVASEEDGTLVGMLCPRQIVDWLGRCFGAGRRIHG